MARLVDADPVLSGSERRAAVRAGGMGSAT
jgi:hypothetical protein